MNAASHEERSDPNRARNLEFFGHPGQSGVLYIFQNAEPSGAEHAQLPLLKADRSGLVACPPGSATEHWVKRHGIATVALPFKPLRHSGGPAETVRSVVRGVSLALSLRRLIRSMPDRRHLFCATVRGGMLASLATLGMRCSVIWVVPDRFPPAPVALMTELLARISKATLLPISGYVRDSLPTSLADAEVAYLGVDVANFKPNDAAPGTPVAAIVGHVSPTKRTDLALDIAERVAKSHPEFRLRIIGRAQYRDEDFALERRIRRRVADSDQLRGRVEFMTYEQDEPRFHGCGLLVHCRTDEPLGMVVIEAMAVGIPVVVPDSGGMLEIVDDCETGFHYRAGDADSAAAAIDRILSDPQEAREMGRAGRNVATTQFAADTYLAAIDRTLAQLDRSII